MKKLRSRIVNLGIIAASISLAVFLFIDVQDNHYKDNRTLAISYISDIASSLRSSIIETASQATAKTRVLSEDPRLITALQQNDRAALQALANRFIHNSLELDIIAFFANDGTIMAVNTVNASSDPIEKHRVDKIMNSSFEDREIIMGCVRNESNRLLLEFQTTCDFTPAFFDSSGLSVAVSAPVLEPATKKKVGVVSSRLNFNRIRGLPVPKKFIESGNEIHLVSAQGDYFSEEINSGRAYAPIEKKTLAKMLKPLIKGNLNELFLEKDGRYLYIIPVTVANTVENGGIYVMVRVPAAWLNYEQKRAGILWNLYRLFAITVLVILLFYGVIRQVPQRSADPTNLKNVSLLKKFSTKELFLTGLPPLLFTFLTLLITFSAWNYARNDISRRTQIQFEHEAETMTLLIQDRLDQYLDALYGARAFFAASKSVERDEWNAYFKNKMNFGSSYPGFVAFRYMEKVSAEQKEDFEQLVRQDKSILKTGYPDFVVHPLTDEQNYHVVKYVYPPELEGAMMGLNVSSNLAHQLALKESAESGSPFVLDAAVLLNNEAETHASQIILPIYANTAPIQTSEERQAALLGYVDAIVDLSGFYSEVARSDKEFDLEVFEINTSTNGDSAETPVFRSKYFPTDQQPGSLIRASTNLEIAGRTWRFDFTARRNYSLGGLYNRFPQMILLAGFAFSLLLLIMLLSLSYSRYRAVRIAKKITLDLERSESQFRVMSESSPLGIFLTDAHGNNIYVNTACQNIMGLSAQQIYGKGWISAVYLEDREKLEKAWHAYSASGAGTFESENRFQHRNGKIVWAHLKASSILDGTKVTGYVGTVDDISAKKEVAEELADSENRFRTLTSNIPGIVYRCHNDKEWTMEFITDAIREVSGYPPSDFIRNKVRSFASIIHPDDEALVDAAVQSALAKKISYEIEYRIKHRDGSLRWVHERGKGVFDKEGLLVSLDGVIFDVSEQKRLESRLLQSQKMETVGTLAGGIAHDLNNALAPVIGYLDIIMHEVGNEKKIGPLLANVRQSAQRCVEVVQRIVDFSKPSTEIRVYLDPSKLIEETAIMLRTVLPSTIELRIVKPKELRAVLGNGTELENVLMNLAINARDAIGGEQGIIEITAENVQEGPFVHIAVKDTGVGIPPENISRIFEPFFTTKDKSRGTGLGLAMVFNTIKQHGGRIDVQSVVDKGTTFHLYLPATTKPVSATTPPPLAKAMLPKGDELILFVDDEEAVRMMGKAFLQRLGYGVLLANEGDEAVRIFKQNANIKAVVMDITMPKMSGKEALKRMLEVDPHAAVIISSGFTSEGTPEDFVNQGAANYIKKPYSISNFAQMLRETLDRRSVR